jgi:hypothetical protein
LRCWCRWGTECRCWRCSCCCGMAGISLLAAQTARSSARELAVWPQAALNLLVLLMALWPQAHFLTFGISVWMEVRAGLVRMGGPNTTHS